jgi:hypothetical protein
MSYPEQLNALTASTAYSLQGPLPSGPWREEGKGTEPKTEGATQNTGNTNKKHAEQDSWSLTFDST